MSTTRWRQRQSTFIFRKKTMSIREQMLCPFQSTSLRKGARMVMREFEWVFSLFNVVKTVLPPRKQVITAKGIV